VPVANSLMIGCFSKCALQHSSQNQNEYTGRRVQQRARCMCGTRLKSNSRRVNGSKKKLQCNSAARQPPTSPFTQFHPNEPFIAPKASYPDELATNLLCIKIFLYSTYTVRQKKIVSNSGKEVHPTTAKNDKRRAPAERKYVCVRLGLAVGSYEKDAVEHRFAGGQ
jgi:hypothetical protein